MHLPHDSDQLQTLMDAPLAYDTPNYQVSLISGTSFCFFSVLTLYNMQSGLSTFCEDFQWHGTFPYPTLPYPALPYPTIPYPTLPFTTKPNLKLIMNIILKQYFWSSED